MRAVSTSGCDTTDERAELIRVRGLVQGVGFRPTVWRLARRHGLRGWVANDAGGVSIRVSGSAQSVEAFVNALTDEAPPLARIEQIERERAECLPADAQFVIAASLHRVGGTEAHTGVVPDAATCADCLREVLDPLARRHRYPFTNCTHCGPRLAIIAAIPYDRSATTMRSFAMCAACAREYDDPTDRRFHAQPIACPVCGPRVWLERADGAPVATDGLTRLDAVASAAELLQQGHIVAVKGLGGFQLACDADDEGAVSRLRQRKRRERRPFALMARDLAVLRRRCVVTASEEALLRSAAAPVVVMDRLAGAELAASVAPGIATLAAMLPNTALHHLLLSRFERPIVLTSGNASDQPQCITNAEARERLGSIADFFLMHDRDIERRVDDSVQRVVAGSSRMLRRARGHAPAPLLLPKGFDRAAPLIAMGAELKNCFCLLRDGTAIVSHHMGDLENAPTHADYTRSIAQYLQLFKHEPQRVAVDLHPDYRSTHHGRELARAHGVPLDGVQHHHAHIASCMAENALALDEGPVLGIALDGLGFGDDGSLWGGEFLRADYWRCDRLATFKPVAMLGGEQAMRQPWRNTYAHLVAAMGWQRFAADFRGLELHDFLRSKPLGVLDGMLSGAVNSPLASSCGRLFDAVAAAAGVCREQARYEGQAAIEFEALVDRATLHDADDGEAYPFTITNSAASGLPCIEPAPMWHALLTDLLHKTPVAVISARFHQGLAIVIVRMIEQLRHGEASVPGFGTLALSGGVFQNRVLLEQLLHRLEGTGLRVLTHRRLPTHDGGLALGQAVVAAARVLRY